MKLTVGTNWEPELVEGLARHPEVADVYAKLAVDLVGGGRPAYVVPKVTRDAAAAHIQACRDGGITFNYLLNASCLSGNEFGRSWREELATLLDDLVEMGVDRVTVTLPYLIEVIKARHPALGVTVSSFAQVDSVERARRFERLGADEIVLDFLAVQRDFELMEALARSVDVTFIALANHTCLYDCPSRGHHANLSSHGSQCGGGGILDYCVLECASARLADPTEMIRSQWIRPEDLELYEEIGISKFKLVDRARSTDWILKAVGAYAARRTPNDDLLEILNAVGSGTLPYADFAEFLRAEAASPDLPGTVGLLASQPFFRIDSRELDGFLETVRGIDCRTTSCGPCGVCARFAARAVQPHPDLPAALAARLPEIRGTLQRYLGRLYDGSVFDVPTGW